MAARRRERPRRTLVPGDGPLANVHPLVAFLAVLAVFVLGLWLGGVAGALVLGVLAAAIGGLLAAAWPRLTPAERGVRVLVLLILVAIALQRVA